MSDKEEISKVIQTYIDGMNFSSAEKQRQLFIRMHLLLDICMVILWK
ncbi:MAG: hypothetical protein CM15mP51_08730 [Porticoccaceae bacterium]|nr:MAG: hypothetical protein CM15mP51_08730 [Porticoccaceae bacterium]